MLPLQAPSAAVYLCLMSLEQTLSQALATAATVGSSVKGRPWTTENKVNYYTTWQEDRDRKTSWKRGKEHGIHSRGKEQHSGLTWELPRPVTWGRGVGKNSCHHSCTITPAAWQQPEVATASLCSSCLVLSCALMSLGQHLQGNKRKRRRVRLREAKRRDQKYLLVRVDAK